MRNINHKNWVKLGDKNSKFYRRSISTNAKRLYIPSLELANGCVTTNQQDIDKGINSYFEGWWAHPSTASPFSYEDLVNHPFLAPIPTSVTPENNKFLCEPFMEEEILHALQSLPVCKAPGFDCISPEAILTMWPSSKRSICEALNHFHSTNTIPCSWAKTKVILLPKTKSPKKCRDFRPISLCTTIYKLLTMILSIRLASIIPNIISDNQAGFIRGREMHDNIMLVQEIAHSLHHLSLRKQGFILKVDFHKAFNSISWNFIRATLTKLGFCDTISPLRISSPLPEELGKGAHSLLPSLSLLYNPFHSIWIKPPVTTFLKDSSFMVLASLLHTLSLLTMLCSLAEAQYLSYPFFSTHLLTSPRSLDYKFFFLKPGHHHS